MCSVLDETFEPAEIPFATLTKSERETAIVLSIDIGSSGVRAALFNQYGNELATVGRPNNRQRNTATRDDARRLMALVIDAIDELLASVPSTVEIELIAISCFWHSLLGVDADGNPTTPILDWSNTQAASAARKLRERFIETEVHARTGCRLHPSYWPAKLLWLREADENSFRLTKRWLSFSEYLTQNLFRSTTASISMASGTGLFIQKSCEWDNDLLEYLKMHRDELPGIAPETITDVSLVGRYVERWPQLRAARLCPGIGDGAANSIGAGCMGKTKLALMIGTSGAARVVYTGEPPHDLPPELWCYRIDRDRIVIGGALSDGGGLVTQLKEKLLPQMSPESVLEALTKIKPDSHGLTILPLWNGERSPGWAVDAHGAIYGLHSGTTPLEIVRGVMEAIAYRFALILGALKRIIPEFEVVASGNALQSSPLWLQIVADVLGREVKLIKTREASLRGAALLALEAAGRIQLIESSAVEFETVVQPDLSLHAKYQAAVERQQRFYEAARPLFK